MIRRMSIHSALTARLRGFILEVAGRLTGDPMLVFRGQQDTLVGHLAFRVADDSYLGPRHHPPVRCATLTRTSHLRLVVAR